MATSLGFLIVARIFQGLGGGAMVPIAQAILLESFPPAKRGQAMAAFSMGIIVAPILGPTLGGWITDNYSWRWIFYINVPVGMLAFLMAEEFVEDPPYIRRNKHANVDFAGFALLAIWLGTLQIVLDKGQEEDWFASDWICWLAAFRWWRSWRLSIWEFWTAHPVVDLRVLRNRNFCTGSDAHHAGRRRALRHHRRDPDLPANAHGLHGARQRPGPQPARVGGVCHRPSSSDAWSGRCGTLSVGHRFLLVAVSSFMLGRINLSVGMATSSGPALSTALASVSFSFRSPPRPWRNLRQDQMGNATGLYNLMRNIGGSIGIAFVTTHLARDAQVHQAMMVVPHHALQPGVFAPACGDETRLPRMPTPSRRRRKHTICSTTKCFSNRSLWAFVDNFRLFGLLCLASIPVVFLFKRIPRHSHAKAG